MNTTAFAGTRYDMSGKVAVITGGAGLLGRQHAAALLALGATTALLDVDAPRLEAAGRELRQEWPGDRVVTTPVDICDKDAIEACAVRLGRVDVLVNNAAIDSKVTGEGLVESSRFEIFRLENWHREIEVGLTGAFLCSQTFGTRMAANGSGVILNIASDLAVISPDQRLYQVEGREPTQQPVKPVTYSVIKTALVGLTRYLATYWASAGIRVNALSPGGVYTGQPEHFVARLASRIPMNRMAAVDEYQAAVQFLCSDASSYMTGQNVVIDGGRTVW